MDWLRQAIEASGGGTTVARETGLSPEHLSNILAGRRRLTPDVVRALADALPEVEAGRWVEAVLGERFLVGLDADVMTEDDA